MGNVSVGKVGKNILSGAENATLVFVLTNACNYRCGYCYENKSLSASLSLSYFRDAFSLDTILKVYEIFCQYNGMPERIVFFGGEPLIKKDLIYDFVNALIKTGDKVPKFDMITNASLLEGEIRDFVLEYFSAVTFSLDGGKEIHDSYRKDAAGNGTFDSIVENIREFQIRNINVKTAVEATLTDAYLEGDIQSKCKETWELMNFLSIQVMDFIPVKGDEYSIFSIHENTGLRQAQDLVNILVDLWFDDFISLQLRTDVVSFHNLLLSLIKKRKPRGCGAGKNYFAVTPDLSVYSCQVALFQGDLPNWHIEEDKIVELRRDSENVGHADKSNPFCAVCECLEGCSCYCRAQWDHHMPEKLPDICHFHKFARRRILERIGLLYEKNEQGMLKKAVSFYYGNKE